MQHLSITFPEDLKVALDRQAKREHTKRSTLLQKAVKVYLSIQHKREMEHLLKEGYLETASEAKELLKEFGHADKESLKHVD